MTHEALDAALAAAAGEGSGLRMVAFSHLDLSEWREGHNYILPQDRPAPSSYDFALRVIPQPVVQPPVAGSLQVAPPAPFLGVANVWMAHETITCLLPCIAVVHGLPHSTVSADLDTGQRQHVLSAEGRCCRY